MSEKNEFKQLIRGMAIDINTETNFQEAVQESYRAYARKDTPSGLLELMQLYIRPMSSNHKTKMADDDVVEEAIRSGGGAFDEFRWEGMCVMKDRVVIS